MQKVAQFFPILYSNYTSPARIALSDQITVILNLCKPKRNENENKNCSSILAKPQVMKWREGEERKGWNRKTQNKKISEIIPRKNLLLSDEKQTKKETKTLVSIHSVTNLEILCRWKIDCLEIFFYFSTPGSL